MGKTMSTIGHNCSPLLPEMSKPLAPKNTSIGSEETIEEIFNEQSYFGTLSLVRLNR